MIQELEQYLRLYVQENQKDWWEWLPMAEFVYNNTIHTSTGVSPFYANYGYHPNSGQAVTRVSNVESAEEFAKRMEYVKTECQAALQHSKTLMKKFFDWHRNQAIEYSSGSKVWLESVNLQTGRPSRKLSDKRVGPFEVLEKVGRAAYRLKVPSHWKVHPVFNEVLLTPYTPPEFPTQRIENRPPPELVEGVEEHEIERIVNVGQKGRGRNRKTWYQVHWKGYPNEEDEWFPIEELEHAKDLIAQYHEDHPEAEQYRRADFWKPKFWYQPSKEYPKKLLFNWNDGHYDEIGDEDVDRDDQS
jgi:hypothetical protein